MVHFASVVSSICDSCFEVIPIFKTRLSDESGERMTGGCAAAGSAAAVRSRRSCTSCRAPISSVPSSKMSTTDDRPSTDLDRRVLRPGTPFIAVSSGTVTRLSTSPVDSPGASVWISTSGGANSGKTSSGVSSAARVPAIISTTARATTTKRRRSDDSTSRRIMSALLADAELDAEQFRSAVGDDLRADGRTAARGWQLAPLMSATATRCRTYCCGARTT